MTNSDDQGYLESRFSGCVLPAIACISAMTLIGMALYKNYTIDKAFQSIPKVARIDSIYHANKNSLNVARQSLDKTYHATIDSLRAAYKDSLVDKLGGI